MAEWYDDLKALPEDLPEYAEELRALVDEQDLDDVTQDKYAGLDTDLSFLHKPRIRSFIDLQQVKLARDHIQRLPEDGETVHAVVSGRYPLWALVPAVAELAAPAKIDELHLVTLSYSKDNAHELLEMLDSGSIGKVWLMVSHYFSSANPHLYDPLAFALKERKQCVLALRTHAKITLLKLTDGRKYIVESSANLRSCKNIEQFTWTRDAGLYDFHRQWIAGLFDKADERDRNEGTQAKA